MSKRKVKKNKTTYIIGAIAMAIVLTGIILCVAALGYGSSKGIAFDEVFRSGFKANKTNISDTNIRENLLTTENYFGLPILGFVIETKPGEKYSLEWSNLAKETELTIGFLKDVIDLNYVLEKIYQGEEEGTVFESKQEPIHATADGNGNIEFITPYDATHIFISTAGQGNPFDFKLYKIGYSNEFESVEKKDIVVRENVYLINNNLYCIAPVTSGDKYTAEFNLGYEKEARLSIMWLKNIEDVNEFVKSLNDDLNTIAQHVTGTNIDTTAKGSGSILLEVPLDATYMFLFSEKTPFIFDIYQGDYTESEEDEPGVLVPILLSENTGSILKTSLDYKYSEQMDGVVAIELMQDSSYQLNLSFDETYTGMDFAAISVASDNDFETIFTDFITNTELFLSNYNFNIFLELGSTNDLPEDYKFTFDMISENSNLYIFILQVYSFYIDIEVL